MRGNTKVKDEMLHLAIVRQFKRVKPLDIRAQFEYNMPSITVLFV